MKATKNTLVVMERIALRGIGPLTEYLEGKYGEPPHWPEGYPASSRFANLLITAMNHAPDDTVGRWVLLDFRVDHLLNFRIRVERRKNISKRGIYHAVLRFQESRWPKGSVVIYHRGQHPDGQTVVFDSGRIEGIDRLHYWMGTTAAGAKQ